jgi:hypothetical protein
MKDKFLALYDLRARCRAAHGLSEAMKVCRNEPGGFSVSHVLGYMNYGSVLSQED